MSFAGNFGPAIDGGMTTRVEAAEDSAAQQEAEDVLSAEAEVEDGPGNRGAG
jgi:hypothetical protein